MYDGTIYKHSIKSLIIWLIFDAILSLLIIGIFMFINTLIRYFTESLTITKKSVIMKKGLINISTIEIPLDKINGVNTKKGPLGLIFGYGDISISSANIIESEIFKQIDNPDKLKQSLLHIA